MLDISIPGLVDTLNRDLFVVCDRVEADEYNHLLEQLGELISYDATGGGAIFLDVKPQRGSLRKYGAKSASKLFPHLEKYEWGNPPDLVALRCVQAAEVGGATLVCDMRPFLEGMSDEDRRLLSTHEVRFVADDALRSSGDTSTCDRPVLDLTDDAYPRLRYSSNYTIDSTGNEEIAKLRQQIHEYFEANHERVLLAPGEVLIFRNTLALHARESFEGLDRHLVRAYVRERRAGDNHDH